MIVIEFPNLFSTTYLLRSDPAPGEPSARRVNAAPGYQRAWPDPLARPLVGLDTVLLRSVAAVAGFLASLAGVLRYLVAGKGKVLTRFESNQP